MKDIGLKCLMRRSKRPKQFRVSSISESTTRLIETIRKENPIYGKAKIAVIIKRDHAVTRKFCR
jgi:hypothetical protein